MKEERKAGRKKKGREDLSVRSRLIKGFPLDLDWQHLNAHTVGYCLHSLKAQNSAIYFEKALWSPCKECWLLHIYQREQKTILKWGLFDCSHFLFVSISK